MKIVSGFLLLFILSANTYAQQIEVDKNRVGEYFQNEQYNEAVAYLMPLLNHSPSIYILNSLGYAYLMNEETETAELFYNKAIAIDSLNFTANKYLAQIEKERQNFDLALRYYQRMLRVQPQNASLYKSAGDLYFLLKMQDSSLLYYAKAYQLQPLNLKYASNYASHLLSQKNYGTADSILNIFLAIDSTNVTAMMLAIRSFYERENYKLAASFSNRWLDTKPDDMNLATTIRLALANYETKNFLASYKLCDTLTKQGIAEERLLYHAARALNKLGRYKESNDLFRQCLDKAISKNAEKYFFESAENFEALKQHKAAIVACDTAYYLFHNPLALYNIGRLYETGLKNREKALLFYRQYLRKASPSTPGEKEFYAYVKERLVGKANK